MSGDPGILALLIGAGGVLSLGLAFAALGFFSGDRARLKRRLTRVTRAVAASQGEAKQSLRLDQSDSSIEGFDRLLKRYLPRPERLRERLAKTGRRIALGEYVLVCMLIALMSFLALDSFLGLKLATALLLSAAMGLWLPHAAIGMLIARRLKRFIQIFPDAIELAVRGLKSGLPVTESIKLVGEDMPDPVGTEFRRITDSFGIGETLEQALWAATKRLDIPEFRFFAISLAVQRETGGNLAETLENLATILRRRRQMKLKIKALSAEARASAMIIGALPFIMFGVMFFFNPDYIRVLIEDPRGKIMLGMALTSLLSGIGIMFKMARFEI